jgi:exosortase
VENLSSRCDSTARHHAAFVALVLLALAVLLKPLSVLLRTSYADDAHSSILLVLPISALLLWRRRGEIFGSIQYSRILALGLIALLGPLVWVAIQADSLPQESWLSSSTLLFACWVTGAFALCYGTRAFKRACFPLLLLFLAAPLPDGLRTQAIVFLQSRSADAAELLFHLANVPCNRAGVVLTLPRVTIEIAQECSGIRSSLVLLIATLVIGHRFVERWWSKAGLIFLFVPLMIAKNGLRIFVLSMLGMYVDRSILTGRLHRNGGILFFALAFACTWGVAKIFHRIESRPKAWLPEPAPTSAIAAKNSA